MALSFTFSDASEASGSTDDTVPAASAITDAVLLDQVKQAIWGLLNGTAAEYRVGNRMVRKVDLKDLREMRSELERRIAAAGDKSGGFVLARMRR